MNDHKKLGGQMRPQVEHDLDPDYIFTDNGNGSYTPVKLVSSTGLRELPAAIYVIVGKKTGPGPIQYFLERTDHFKLDKEVFGSVVSDTKRYFRSFEKSPNLTMGVGLFGAPGSGKTMTMKTMFKTSVEMGYPVLIVPERIPAEDLITLLSKIPQTIVLGIDEFDKKYYDPGEDTSDASEASQMGLLPLFDGNTGGGRKLIVFSGNNLARINNYFIHRPGRVRYMKAFSTLSFDVVRDYLDRKHPNLSLSHKFVLLNLCYQTGLKWTFDSMVELLREMEEYNESPREAAKVMFDAKLETDLSTKGVLTIQGQSLPMAIRLIVCDDGRIVMNAKPMAFVDELSSSPEVRGREEVKTRYDELKTVYEKFIFAFVIKEEYVKGYTDDGVMNVGDDTIDFFIELNPPPKVITDEELVKNSLNTREPVPGEALIAMREMYKHYAETFYPVITLSSSAMLSSKHLDAGPAADPHAAVTNFLKEPKFSQITALNVQRGTGHSHNLGGDEVLPTE